MNVLQIIDEAREYIKDEVTRSTSFPDDSVGLISDSVMLRFLNREKEQLENQLVSVFENFLVTSTSISLISGQESYSMPTDSDGNLNCLKVIRVEDITTITSPVPLRPLPFNEKDDFNGYPFDISSVGDLSYSIYGNSFVIRPIPNKDATDAIRVYYEKRSDALVSQSEVPNIPIQFHELLILGVVRRCLIKMEANADSYAVLKNEYNELKRELIPNSENRQVQRPRSVRSIREGSRRLI